MLEKGESKMSIWDDIKKGLKGSEEYQAGKAKRKAKRAKSPVGKAVKQVAKDVKSAVKGSKEYQAGKAKRKAAKAKKKEGKTWTKAVKKQKKAGGDSLSSLVKKRSGLTKGTAEYASVQNKINAAYGVKKRHKATVASPAKTFGKEGLKKKAQKASKSRISTPSAKKQIAEVSKQAKKVKPTQPTPSVVDTIDVDTTMEGGEFGKYAPEKMAGGGKVESNPYGWPSSDSRKR